MRVKRREVTDPGQLQTLVIDHVDGIEPGLAVLDSRLLLGQATIDVVGLDANGALVLIAVGSIADEQMLLKAVEAYSWCLEYPEAIRRLYPAAHISSSQPPRLVFVVERMPDSFHRKIKQLGFPEVDCVEFRYFDVEGTPAVYFETLARLRRGAAATAPAPEPATTSTASVTGRPTSMRLQKLLSAERPGLVREPAQIVSLVHRSVPRVETPKPAMTTPRMDNVVVPRLGDERAAAAAFAVSEPETAVAPEVVVPEPEPITPASRTIELVSDDVVAPESLPAPEDIGVGPALAPEPAVEPIAMIEPPEPPAVEASEPEPVLDSVEAPEPLVSVAVDPDIVAAPEPEVAPLLLETITTPEPAVVAATPDVADEIVLELETERAPVADVALELVVEPLAPIATPAPETPAPAPSVFARRPAETAAPAVERKVSFADAAKDLLSVTNKSTAPSVEEAAPAAEERTTAFMKPGGAFARPAGQKPPRTIAPPPSDPQPITGGKLGAATKRVTPQAPVASPDVATAPAAQPETTPPPAAPQGFEGLQFPNDGVLTRQWMEFLNQMAAGK
jgi:hypothetical protein